MKWFKQRIINWLHSDGNSNIKKSRQRDTCEPVMDGSSGSIDANGFRMTVFKARGGTVIETFMYDQVKDRANRGLYVVTDEMDLGNELGKIITMENLKS